MQCPGGIIGTMRSTYLNLASKYLQRVRGKGQGAGS
jgi:hypothetical protein